MPFRALGKLYENLYGGSHGSHFSLLTRTLQYFYVIIALCGTIAVDDTYHCLSLPMGVLVIACIHAASYSYNKPTISPIVGT